jgi:cytochrome oxidase Cu insertion factor (SCO1/SenC/PrrC family)
MLSIKGIGLITVAGFLVESRNRKAFRLIEADTETARTCIKRKPLREVQGKTIISKQGRARLWAVLFKVVILLIAKNSISRSTTISAYKSIL